MTPKIALLPTDENGKQLTAFYKPGTHCSRCHQTIAPPKSPGIYMPHGSGYNVFLIERCESCSCISLVEYKGVSLSPFRNFNEPRFRENVCDFDLTDYRPIRIPNDPLPETFSDIIRSISPRFEKIYNEAKRAEELHLFEICGMGYRKALEFLVKDYLISLKSSDDAKESIKNSTQLGDLINTIPNEHMKSLAKGASWLGNDECHYTRKNDDYSIEHLKDWIHSLTYFIKAENDFNTSQELIKKT